MGREQLKNAAFERLIARAVLLNKYRTLLAARSLARLVEDRFFIGGMRGHGTTSWPTRLNADWRSKTPQAPAKFFGLTVPAQLGMQPCPGVSPVALGRCGRNAQDLCRLGNSEPGKIAQPHELGFSRIECLKSRQGIIQRQQIDRWLRRCDLHLVQILAFQLAAPLDGLPPPRL